MNQSDKESSLGDNLRQKIEKEKIKMKPKSYFITQAILGILGTIIIFIILIFSVSFIHFDLHRKGLLYLFKFGWLGSTVLFNQLPWLFIFIILILIILLIIIAEHFAIAYHHSLLTGFLFTIVIIGIVTIIIINLNLHPLFSKFSLEKEIPLAKILYHCSKLELTQKVKIGIVSAATKKDFNLTEISGKTWQVIILPTTRILTDEGIEEEDEVLVWGKSSDSTVKAKGVMEFDPEEFKKFELEFCD